MKLVKISKLDAARRQILTAIRLYFNYGDIVSMHTLAAAAFKITQDICDADPERFESVTGWVSKCIKPDAQKMFWKALHATANYFKHAEHDPHSVYTFNPQESENLLFFAAYQYQQLTQEWSAEFRLLITWYMFLHPNVFDTPKELVGLSGELFSADRNKYWQEVLPLLHETIDNNIIEQAAAGYRRQSAPPA